MRDLVICRAKGKRGDWPASSRDAQLLELEGFTVGQAALYFGVRRQVIIDALFRLQMRGFLEPVLPVAEASAHPLREMLSAARVLASWHRLLGLLWYVLAGEELVTWLLAALSLPLRVLLWLHRLGARLRRVGRWVVRSPRRLQARVYRYAVWLAALDRAKAEPLTRRARLTIGPQTWRARLPRAG